MNQFDVFQAAKSDPLQAFLRANAPGAETQGSSYTPNLLPFAPNGVNPPTPQIGINQPLLPPQVQQAMQQLMAPQSAVQPQGGVAQAGAPQMKPAPQTSATSWSQPQQMTTPGTNVPQGQQPMPMKGY